MPVRTKTPYVGGDQPLWPGRLLDDAKNAQEWTVGFLRAMVETESPSDEKAAVDRCVGLVERQCLEMGGRARRHRNKAYGDLLEARFGPPNRGRRPILLLGHLDTVWPLGTLAKMPFRIGEGRIWGPGVLDMKAGVAMGLAAVRILTDSKLPCRQVILLLNSDEEVGSPVSRAVTERLAAQCEAVYVLEPAQTISASPSAKSAGISGAYKTARKGVGEYTLRISGIAAHSGVDFGSGHSAINELARQVERIVDFTDLDRGLTVNVGVIGGGTRSNVIAGAAWADIDVRITKRSDAAGIERLFRSLRAIDKGCRIEISGGINRPPMERTPATVALFNKAATFAAEMGFQLEEAATGGGSDGNFTSALGIPTLDGMGAVGEGAHAAHESLLVEHIAPRTALIAAMLTDPVAATS